MPIEIEGPDGKVHSFADGTMPDVIDKQMSSLYGGGSLSPFSPQGLPGAGDRTPAAGAVMPSSQSVPPYQTAEDRQNIGLSMLLPRGSVQALQNTPGHAMRMEYAKKVGGDQAALEERQRVGSNILRSYAQLLHKFQTADDDTLRGAIGPGNTKPFKEYVPLVGGMTLPEAAAAYKLMPNLTGAKSADKAWNLQNLFAHDVHGITNAFMSGAGKSLNMSDTRQEAFDSTMRDFMKATSREEGQHILDHAKAIIANDFGIPMNVADNIIRQHIQGASKVPPAAAQYLREHANDEETVRQFEMKYGNGSSRYFLQQGQ